MNAGLEQLVGKVLGGRYRIERPLGAGGMGAVFEATQLDLGRSVAVKVLLDVDPRGIARLRQEALTAGSMSCPHVVSIFDFQTPAGEPPFIVMEILPGHSLSKLLKQQPVLPVARAARIACQMLIGLEAAHRAGVVHRDVKPSNTWLVFGPGIEEHVKMLDFGIAKMLGDGRTFRTTTGSVLGTPAYLAPEQLRGAALDARVDIHAVGVVLFVMLTGSLPWRATGASVYAEVLEREPPPVHTITPEVPPELSRIVARALAKNPDHRFARAADMRAALEPFAAKTVSAPTYMGALDPHSGMPSAFVAPSGPGLMGPPPTVASGCGGSSSMGPPPTVASGRGGSSSMGPPPTVASGRAAPLNPSVPVAPTANMLPVAMPSTGPIAPTTSSNPHYAPSGYAASGSYGAPTAAPAPARASSLLLPIVVGCGFLLLAAVGVVVAIMVVRQDGAAATAPVVPSAVVATGDASTADAAVTASSAIDAGARVVVATTSRATRAQPPRPGIPVAPVAPVAPASASAAPKAGASCWCSDNFGGRALCTAPMVARCDCSDATGATICAKRDSDGSCDEQSTFGGPGRRTGQPCAGFIAVGHKPVPATGTTGCHFCYGPTQRVPGTEGAACKGSDAEGTTRNGRFVCDP